jgi:molecular chaperone DnaK (HSP70)
MTTVAIDFGTSNTVISRLNNVTGQAEILSIKKISQQIADNPPLIPSLVYVENASENKIILGQEVRDRGLDLKNDPRFFRGFKRGIGTEIKGFTPVLDEVTVNFEQVGEWFLNNLITKINAQEKIDSLVLTVPVDSFESYRKWLTDICQNWDINEINLLDEPTAAALGYGTEAQELILVVDFGGGTLDLSLVQLNLTNKNPQGFLLKWGDKLLGKNNLQQEKIAKVIGKSGMNLGGADLDNWLLDYFATNINTPKNILISRLVERLKIKLSTEMTASEVYFDDENFDSYEFNLSREEFEQILTENGFFSKLDDLMTNLLQQGRRNGIEKNDIDAVLLVGGTSKIPAVKNWLTQYFDNNKIKAEQPFTAIASGALQLKQGIAVQDFLYHSYGIRYWNRRENRHSWHPIIKTGQPYPMINPVEITLGASVDAQPSIELIIGELGTENSNTEVYFDGGRLVTRQVSEQQTKVIPLNDREGARTIAQLNPVGYPGGDRLRVQFRVDNGRFLRITVYDLLINETLLDNQIVAELN